MFSIAPSGVVLDNVAQMKQWAEPIKAHTVDSRNMPFMNKTQMTDEERITLGQWIVENTSE